MTSIRRRSLQLLLSILVLTTRLALALAMTLVPFAPFVPQPQQSPFEFDDGLGPASNPKQQLSLCRSFDFADLNSEENVDCFRFAKFLPSALSSPG